MGELSPAAQAVFWAFNSQFDWIEDGVPGPQFKAVAAALRAAADQVVPKCSVATSADYAAGANNERIVIRNQLLAIATELEGQP